MDHDDIYQFDDRLVRFAGESVFFFRRLEKDESGLYYGKQLLRSSGSACLNYGEAQGTITPRDFINKASIVLKELKESKNCLKVMSYIDSQPKERREWILTEAAKLIAITQKMIDNKRGQ